MDNKITIHTDASNILNSNKCKLSSIIKFDDKVITTVDYLDGRINQAELIAVLKALEKVERDYQPVDHVIEVYTDHLPNSKLLNRIIGKSEKDLDKINRILKRKGLSWQDFNVLSSLTINNKLEIKWIPRKENRDADKLCT